MTLSCEETAHALGIGYEWARRLGHTHGLIVGRDDAGRLRFDVDKVHRLAIKRASRIRDPHDARRYLP